MFPFDWIRAWLLISLCTTFFYITTAYATRHVREPYGSLLVCLMTVVGLCLSLGQL